MRRNIAWRDDLVRRGLGGSTIRHRLASLASLFEKRAYRVLAVEPTHRHEFGLDAVGASRSIEC